MKLGEIEVSVDQKMHVLLIYHVGNMCLKLSEIFKNKDFVDTYLLTKFGIGMSYRFQDIAVFDSYDVIIT